MGSLLKPNSKKPKCKYCGDEGIIWKESKKEGKSVLYRCPYCKRGKEHPMQELPFMKKKGALAIAGLLYFAQSL
jgi:predicted RNA-binding Zn-ribbon protein involved in translation (DUF1610 family)